MMEISTTMMDALQTVKWKEVGVVHMVLVFERVTVLKLLKWDLFLKLQALFIYMEGLFRELDCLIFRQNSLSMSVLSAITYCGLESFDLILFQGLESAICRNQNINSWFNSSSMAHFQFQSLLWQFKLTLNMPNILVEEIWLRFRSKLSILQCWPFTMKKKLWNLDKLIIAKNSQMIMLDSPLN